MFREEEGGEKFREHEMASFNDSSFFGIPE